MTLFNLLKFKFTQIFLMSQNGFSKMTYRWMWPNYWWIRPNYRRMRSNFGFLKEYYYFLTSNVIRPNFSKIYRFFFKILKIHIINQLQIFLLRTKFSNNPSILSLPWMDRWSCAVQRRSTTKCRHELLELGTLTVFDIIARIVFLPGKMYRFL
jgi:hypothetical protein